MKTKHLLLLCFLLLSMSNFAQRGVRIAYVDMDYILKSVPEYQEAVSLLDKKVIDWKKEIEGKFNVVNQQKETLEKEKVFLTKELIKEREDEIVFQENQILDYQQKRFGPNGDLDIQKRQLAQPVQDQVFNAVQEIAAKRQYDFVFDKSADVVMLYSAKKYDISDLIVRIITRNAKIDANGNKNEETIESILDEPDPDTLSKQEQIANKRDERLRLLEERKKAIEAERQKRQLEFDQRRQRLLDEREARRTGKTVEQLRSERGESSTDSTAVKVDARTQQLEDKKQAVEKQKQERLQQLQDKKQQLLLEQEARRTGKTVDQLKKEKKEDVKDSISGQADDKAKQSIDAKKKEAEDKKTVRAQQLEDRKKAIEAERAKRLKEFEDRRKKLEEEKLKKKNKENNQ
ncbi:MAG: OmpH family outer membrane protein [Flavobacteriaceae bacterium]|nr:OmpH family outer membrane protein [Flavobacteriaceae bacterium]